jgi:hypothetical protein
MPTVGAVTDVIVAALGGSAAVGALLSSVRAWLSSRHERPNVKITVDGRSVEINLDDPDEAARFLKEYLSRHSADERESAG